MRRTPQRAGRNGWTVGPGALSALLLLLLVAGGCASSGSSRYTADETRIAYGYLVSEVKAPSHPDTTSALSIVEKENKFEFELDRSYEELVRSWSSTWRSQSARRTFDAGRDFSSYATLWSLDLSLASLVPDEGVDGLSKALARKRIAQRRQEHRQVLQIDVYRFVGSPPGGGIGSTIVGGPGDRVTLRDDQGNEYRPARVENAPPREAVLGGGRSIYRRNIFFFERQVEGRDILDGVQRLRLYVNDSVSGRYYFTWNFEDVEAPPSSP